ncbi:MAG: murein biosynthesis integral membrane protein MurJ [Anaerolineaceae bacterium]|nr:murein biosynthesis integral membrane protein MurJ [Anaerolineaceae bacterium]
MKLSRLSKISLLLAVFFLLDKLLAILRQVLIARQFGLSTELDAFNVANNIPDLLFALISGGALAMAFIPVLTEVLTRQGQTPAWTLFSRIANLAFLVTSALAIVVALFAEPLVRNEVGIAPGFTSVQQDMVIQLMRLNLIATVIFSISGLVMAGLQANQHFLLPALAPIFYNLGQIFGVLVLSPTTGYTIAGVTLPAFGLGVSGLVYGVIIGAALHLLIQVPGLIKFHFKWTPSLGLKDTDVKKVLRLLGPRLLTMLLIQSIFIIRDNLASRLAAGAVTSLTYGWMLQQVPETLIGTAIGTALLPTLAEHFSRGEKEIFMQTIQRAVQVLIAITLPIAAVMAIGLRPLMGLAFDFGTDGTRLLAWVTAAFLLGLMGHSLKEVGARSFYARQNAWVPLITAGINIVLYIALGASLYRPLGAPGIALTDSLVFTTEAVLLLIILGKKTALPVQLGSFWWRALAALVTASLVTWGLLSFLEPRTSVLIAGTVPMILGFLCATPWIWKEIRALAHL